MSNLQQYDKDGNRSVICSCVCESVAPANWASRDDVAELLREIVLSYRLVFGQNKQSRKLFRKLRPFAGIPPEGRDQLLFEVCGRKRFNCPIPLNEREEYDVRTNFSHLRTRIVRLNSYALAKKPRSLRQLWLDTGDSASWLTFWTLLLFGSISVVLGLLQAIFQVLQYIQGM